MTDVSIIQEVLTVLVQPEGAPAVALQVPAAPQVLVTPLGAQGPIGPPPGPGPGFVIVGTEIRFSIATLPQG